MSQFLALMVMTAVNVGDDNRGRSKEAPVASLVPINADVEKLSPKHNYSPLHVRARGCVDMLRSMRHLLSLLYWAMVKDQ